MIRFQRFPLGSGLCMAVLSCVVTMSAADWPQYRGANGSGFSPDAKPPLKWSDKENLKWKTPLPGPGSSSPIVISNRVYVTCYSGYGAGAGGDPEKLKRHLICLDRADGRVLWDKSTPAAQPEDAYQGYITEHGYASNTPTADGERIYAFFGKSGVFAFDKQGRQLWQVDVGKQSSNRRWGSGASLILHGDMLIVNAAEESRSVRALDKRTGQELWKATGAALELCYSTPVLFEAEGKTQLLLSLPEEIWALNPKTGKLAWHAETKLPGNISPMIVTAGDIIVAFGGFPKLGAVALRAGGQDNATDRILWSGSTSTYVPTPVSHGEHLYFVSDGGFATCLETKTGKVIYKERLPGAMAGGRGARPFYASAVLGKGHYFAVSRRGGTFVIEAAPEFKLTASNSLADDTDFNGTPALVGNELFLRSNRALYCIQEK